MTVHTLAIAVLVTTLFHLLPGTAYKNSPTIDWGRPNVYIAFLQTVLKGWLLWDLLS